MRAKAKEVAKAKAKAKAPGIIWDKRPPVAGWAQRCQTPRLAACNHGENCEQAPIRGSTLVARQGRRHMGAGLTGTEEVCTAERALSARNANARIPETCGRDSVPVPPAGVTTIVP